MKNFGDTYGNFGRNKWLNQRIQKKHKNKHRKRPKSPTNNKPSKRIHSNIKLNNSISCKDNINDILYFKRCNRPIWVCNWCTYRNIERSMNCKICGISYEKSKLKKRENYAKKSDKNNTNKVYGCVRINKYKRKHKSITKINDPGCTSIFNDLSIEYNEYDSIHSSLKYNYTIKKDNKNIISTKNCKTLISYILNHKHYETMVYLSIFLDVCDENKILYHINNNNNNSNNKLNKNIISKVNDLKMYFKNNVKYNNIYKCNQNIIGLRLRLFFGSYFMQNNIPNTVIMIIIKYFDTDGIIFKSHKYNFCYDNNISKMSSQYYYDTKCMVKEKIFMSNYTNIDCIYNNFVYTKPFLRNDRIKLKCINKSNFFYIGLINGLNSDTLSDKHKTELIFNDNKYKYKIHACFDKAIKPFNARDTNILNCKPINTDDIIEIVYAISEMQLDYYHYAKHILKVYLNNQFIGHPFNEKDMFIDPNAIHLITKPKDMMYNLVIIFEKGKYQIL